MPFAIDGLVLQDSSIAALAKDGIDAPNAAQLTAIPAILAGDPVLIHAATGTGKTLAYLLPLLQQLIEDPTLRAVVFAPGTELAMQIQRVAKAYAPPDFPIATATTTTNPKRQKKRLTKSTRLIIGTPDRLIELFKGSKLKGVRRIVLDEIEPILGARDAPFLSELLSRSTPVVQLTVAAATLGKRSEAFVRRFMPDVVRVETDEQPLVDAIRHVVVPVKSGRAKHMAVARYLEQNNCKRAMLFASEPGQQSFLYHFLVEEGFAVVTVSRDRTKGDRQRGLAAFRSGKANVLITTDSSARGIDVPDVPHILHFDIPRSKQAYVHRAGRTGRAGSKGTSALFVEPQARRRLERLQRDLELTFTTP